MPNILAHGYITSEVKGDDWLDINLGSTLPDFTSMYRDYQGESIRFSEISLALDTGIELHHQTDVIYDRRVEKPQITTLLADDLVAEGLNQAAARLSAAFLGDVMLDGVLLDYDGPKQAFLRLAKHVTKGNTTLEDQGIPADFTYYVRQYYNRGLPTDYAKPDRLAAMLQSRLSYRAGSSLARQDHAFSPEQVPPVAEVIGRHMEKVGGLGMAALKQTIAGLQG